MIKPLSDEAIAQAMRNGFIWYPIVSTADRAIAQEAQRDTLRQVVEYIGKMWDESYDYETFISWLKEFYDELKKQAK